MKEYTILVKSNENKGIANKEMDDAIKMMENGGWKIEGIQSTTEMTYGDATMYIVSQVMKRKK